MIDTALVNLPLCPGVDGVPPVTCYMPTPVEPPQPPIPMLSITKHHTGDFRVGLPGTYTLTICNDPAGGITNAPVTVVDTLPDGFGGISMTGVGWVCDLATLTCTRSDLLLPGNCFPPITLVVSVS